MAARQFWLVKSEPDCFSIHDLAKSPAKTTCWSGVRNYQARNFMRDQMHVGDGVLFYHSGANPPAIAGTAIVAREAYPDSTARDPKDDHYDPASTAENPIWLMVDIKLDEIFDRPIQLDQLRGVKGLEKMELLRKGSRLSVQPVTAKEFELVLSLAHRKVANGAQRKGKKAKRSAKPATKATSTSSKTR